MIELLSPKTDVVFQKIFGKIGNEEITKRLISLIIGKEIEEIILDASNRLERELEKDKLGLLDVRAKLKNGEDFNIEMQVQDNHNIVERLLYYWSKLYGRKLEKGKEYKDLKPTVSILIADYKLKELKNVEEYHTVWNLRERKYKDIIINKNIELHIIELPKMEENKIDINKEELELWLTFLKNPYNERMRGKMEENEVLKQAMEELKHLSGRPDFQRIVELREKAIRDESNEKYWARKEGLEEGREEGREEEREKIAKEMLLKELDIDLISLITKLNLKQIEKIKMKINK